MPFTIPSLKRPRWLQKLKTRGSKDSSSRESPLHFANLSSLRENIVLDRNQKELLLLGGITTTVLLFEIESKIWRLEKQLTELRTRRDTLREKTAIFDALWAPVRKLPAEILGEIFQLCVPIEPTHVTPFDSRDAPLLLTHVCHRWRQVAQGTPQLWNRLILFGRAPETFFSSIWFNNSGSLPLEITVDKFHGQAPLFPIMKLPNGEDCTSHGWRIDGRYVWIWPEGAFDQSSRIVVEKLSRIRRLTLFCAANELRDYFPTETMVTIPSIEELSVNYTHPGGLDINPSEYSNYDVLTPRLQNLYLDGGAELLLPVLKSMSNLRRLYIRGNCTLEMLVDFIGMCPALQRIDAFDIEVKHPRENMDTGHIVLPGVSHLGLGIYYPLDDGLEVGSDDWTHRTAALERLRTPNLRCTILQCLPYCLRILSNCVADSQSGLHRLTIRDMDLNATLLSDATSIFPAIDKMEFINCGTSVGFWEFFKHAEDTPRNMWTLPKLKALTLEAVHFAHEEELVQFIERQAPPMRSEGPEQLPIEGPGMCYLEKIKLIRCPFSIGTFNALERLRETREGLSVIMIDCWYP